MQKETTPCDSTGPYKAPRVGIERDDVAGGNSKGLGKASKSSGALSGAESGISEDFDPDLQEVIDAWPTWSDAGKMALLVKVRSAIRLSNLDLD